MNKIKRTVGLLSFGAVAALVLVGWTTEAPLAIDARTLTIAPILEVPGAYFMAPCSDEDGCTLTTQHQNPQNPGG